MKKNIRLTESELVSLVKRTIMESTEKLDFWETLSNYSGTNPTLIDIKSKMKNIPLSEKQKKFAYNLLKKEFPNIKHFDNEMNSALYLLIKNDKSTRSLVIRKGIDTYKQILTTDKQFLFKEYADNHGASITIGSPDEKWGERNLNDLREFYKSLGEKRLSGMVEIDSDGDGSPKVKMTLRQAITKLGELVKTDLNSFKGFIENGQWSVLNKIDTNYTNWGKVIIDLDDKGLLGTGSPKQKIEEFFKQRNIESICSSEEINHIKKVQDHYRGYIPGMSYAEYKVYKDGEKNYSLVKTNIEMTTREGDLAEANFRGHLKLNGIKNILDFSSPGNQVDMVFGVDTMAKLPFKKETGEVEYVWTPVQIKSRRPYNLKLRIFDFNIDGISVWPTSKGDYGYVLSPNGEEKSFNLDFLNK